LAGRETLEKAEKVRQPLKRATGTPSETGAIRRLKLMVRCSKNLGLRTSNPRPSRQSRAAILLTTRRCRKKTKTVEASSVINHIDFAHFVFAERRNPHSTLSKHARLTACDNAVPNRNSKELSAAIVPE
jgi:hypothetical protein